MAECPSENKGYGSEERKDTERVLAGGVFGLYTSEDIKNAKGEVLLEKDSLIEQRVTDEKGQIILRQIFR